ncbi:MAG: TadE/TadG family type IV pilus assembly protein [Rickettsiales bacterium]
MKKMLQKLHNFKRDQGGLAYLEFAVTLPFLLVLFMGSVEVTRFIIAAQKVEKSASTISDVVAQSETISVAQLDQLIAAVGEVMQPFEFGTDGYVIITSVSKNEGSPALVNWQYKGGGSWTQSSQVGGPGSTANLPNGLTLNNKDTVIVAEVYFNYSPMMANNGVIEISPLYKVGVFKPRLGDLQTLDS